jgi:hypothetical protein
MKGGIKMIEIPSKVEGMKFDLYKLEQLLKPAGYSIGGNWDYDHGAFDYKLNDEDSYQFLRVPFNAIDGQLDKRNCTVQLGRPFILSHNYENNLEEDASNGLFSSTFNQFQGPVDKDAQVPDRFTEVGKALVKELENILGA